MPLTIEVSLLSGSTVSLEAEPDESLETFKCRAQRALAVGRGRLVHSSGAVLGGAATLQEHGLQNGDSLTLHIAGFTFAATAMLSLRFWGTGLW